MMAVLLQERPADAGLDDFSGFARFGSHSWPTSAVRACLCHFSVARFDERLFARHRVDTAGALAGAVTRRRAEFLAGRLCAAQALARLGVPGGVPIGADRSPVWPVGTIGSITHCAETAMAVALKKDCVVGVGIDLERLSACREASLDASHFLNDSERRVLDRAGIASEDHAVLGFSVKESFFKAAYPHVGRYFGFSAVSIVAADPSHRRLTLVVAQDLSRALQRGMQVTGEYALLGTAMLSTLVTIRATDSDRHPSPIKNQECAHEHG